MDGTGAQNTDGHVAAAATVELQLPVNCLEVPGFPETAEEKGETGPELSQETSCLIDVPFEASGVTTPLKNMESSPSR